MDLIDRDKLDSFKFRSASERMDLPVDYMVGWNDAVDGIMCNAPTVDAEPVIRCKDCIYARMTIDGDFAKYCLAWQDGDALMMDSLYLPSDFYCAYAERKEE